MIFWIVLIVLIALFLFLISPSPKHRRADKWKGTLFAHRGLHGDGLTENTLEAFERACVHGCGIELDVQLSKDGAVVVFHDDTLERLTGDKRRVDQVDFDELRSLTLIGGGRIPSFEEVLRRVNGRVPLLVELKNGKRNDELCAKTAALLKNYKGAYVMESFNPLILKWWRKNEPSIIRGQLVGAKVSYLATMGPVVAFLLSRLLLNFLARPDFVAYDVNAVKFNAPKVQRALFHTPLAAWTVRDAGLCHECLERGEMPIFEGFIPEK